MTETILKSQEVTTSPSLPPIPASTIASKLPELEVTANGCGNVTVTQTNDHHHYHQSAGPFFTALLETIARLEAKVDELSVALNSGRKKHKKTKRKPGSAVGL